MIAFSGGYYHPANEDEVKELILLANERKMKIRVRGSGHSVAGAIYTSNFKRGEKDTGGIDLMLDKMLAVKIDKSKKQVTVEAGCHLGRDPYDPSGTSNWINSLFYQINQAGLAVPDMGGIIHQAVGGFVSTGSAGGSIQHAFDDQIIAFRMVDGTGKVHEFTRDSRSDEFYAAGVSMGLFGIITSVTFQLVEKFDIIGEQSTLPISNCGIDLFGPGTSNMPSTEKFFRDTEYARLMWWPQQGVEKMVVWKASQMKPDEYTPYNPITHTGTGTLNDFHPRPYLEFPKFHGTQDPAEAAGGLFYSIAGNWSMVLHKYKLSWILKLFMRIVGWLYPKHILPLVVNIFNPLDSESDPPGPQKFWDTWWDGLPMDNKVDDKLVPVDFTEIWIPLDKSREVMTTLRDFYKQNGYKATGSFSCEIYSAKKSDFWMSPSYDRDVVRVDIFWFGYNAGNPAENYYPQFWNLLMRNTNFSCRFHWGKYMPVAPEYLKAQYPKWNAFMALREKMDPHQIFLTNYWRQRLGIPAR